MVLISSFTFLLQIIPFCLSSPTSSKGVKKGFNPIADKRQKAYARKKKIQDGLETLLTHVGILHEPAHWELPVDSGKGCPFDVYWHDKILESDSYDIRPKGSKLNGIVSPVISGLS